MDANSPLSDENADVDVQFRSVKLNINSMDGDGEGISRDRPFSASMASRTSNASTKSKVAQNPNTVIPDSTAKNLFCYRQTKAAENAVEDCKTSVIVKGIDGELQSYWLLTEIDHWDLEKEKLVLLTTKSLLIVKYDFVAMKVKGCLRISLNIINFIEIGDLFYPQYSVMPPREHGAVRIHWSGPAPTLLQRWNPWSEDLGALTLTHHLLAYNAQERETTTFDASDMADTLLSAVQRVREQEGRGSDSLRVERRPIVVESYASAVSLVYNQSHLGFSMERGGISF